MMSLGGVLLVARQELRTRLRTGRSRWLLTAWFVVVGGTALLMRWEWYGAYSRQPGVPLFGGLLLFVLALTLLISPTLTAQSINGDRERGTLATLQLTQLSPAEIAIGKLLASWSVGLSLLGLTLPFIAWPVIEGDIEPLRAVVVTVVVALLMGVVCAVSMAWSALVVRSITSALLSYLTVFALTLGTPLVYLLTTDGGFRHTGDDMYYERKWWLLAPNPFVVLADASPRLPKPKSPRDLDYDAVGYQGRDPLGSLSRNVREIRAASPLNDHPPTLGEAVWPYGLAFDLILAGGAVWITTRRLRVPVRGVSRGVRIA